jgi:hypothetical protein
MTDEELKRKLLATQWSSRRGATIPVNPDGAAAWRRIKELKATILQMGENAAKDAKYYQARIDELFDDLEAKNAKLKAQGFGAIHTDGSRSGGQPIKGTDDDG